MGAFRPPLFSVTFLVLLAAAGSDAQCILNVSTISRLDRMGCPYKPVGERIASASYLRQIFTWPSVVAFVMMIITIGVAKYLFSIPIYCGTRSTKGDYLEANSKASMDPVGPPPSHDASPPPDSPAVAPEPPPATRTRSDTSVQMLRQFSLNRELTQNDNKSMALAFTGYTVAAGLIMVGALSFQQGSDPGPVGTNFAMAFIWAFIGFFLLFLSHYICDIFILRELKASVVKQQTSKEIAGNQCVGLIEASCYVASGLNIRATLSGGGSGGSDPASTDDMWSGFGVNVVSALLFYFLAQFVWVLLLMAYEKITVYDDQEAIVKDNWAVGVDYSSTVLSFAILSSTAIKTSYSILFFFVYVLLGGFLVLCTRSCADICIIPYTKHISRAEEQPTSPSAETAMNGSAKRSCLGLDDEIERDRNWGLAFLSGTFRIAFALALQAIVPIGCTVM